MNSDRYAGRDSDSGDDDHLLPADADGLQSAMRSQPAEPSQHSARTLEREHAADSDSDTPRHPFESPIPRQYSLATLLVVMSFSSVFFWLTTFESGRDVLGILGVLCGVIAFFFFLAACFSWLFGTAGEIQRRNEEEESSKLADEEERPAEL